MHKVIAALLLVLPSAAMAGDLAPPTVVKKPDSYVVTFHVEHPRDVGQRFQDHVDLAKEALGSTSSSINTVRQRPDGGSDVTYEIFN